MNTNRKQQTAEQAARELIARELRAAERVLARRIINRDAYHSRTGISRNAYSREGGRVELTIDARKLAARLGPRALRSKTGRARYIDGAIIARRVAE